jgi:hypothetical protein
MTNRGWEAAAFGAIEKFFFEHCMKGTWETIRFGDEEVKQHWTEAYVEFLEVTMNDKNKLFTLMEWLEEREWDEYIENERKKDEAVSI